MAEQFWQEEQQRDRQEQLQQQQGLLMSVCPSSHATAVWVPAAADTAAAGTPILHKVVQPHHLVP